MVPEGIADRTTVRKRKRWRIQKEKWMKAIDRSRAIRSTRAAVMQHVLKRAASWKSSKKPSPVQYNRKFDRERTAIGRDLK